MLISITLASPVLASPPSQGDTVTVSDSVTWTDGTFDGEIIIQNGGELHWTGDVDVREGSKIIVEEGGMLQLDSAHLKGENAASTLLIYDATEIEIDAEIADTSATMTLYFNIDVPETAHLNLTIDETTTNDITGTSKSFTVDLSQTVNIVVDHFYPLFLGITHVELFHSNAELMTISADELTQQGGNIVWNEASFSIENYGTVVIED